MMINKFILFFGINDYIYKIRINYSLILNYFIIVVRILIAIQLNSYHACS